MHTFNRGSWEDGSPLPEWEGDENLVDYLARIKYTTGRTMFGHEDAGHIEIFESSEEQSFVANVTTSGGHCYNVFLPDFPSFMMFVRDYVPPFTTDASHLAQQEILSLMEKFFQAQHGHPAHTICRECDPEGWKAHEKWARERSR